MYYGQAEAGVELLTTGTLRGRKPRMSDTRTIIDVLTSLDAYNGDKMNHIPLNLIRKQGSSTWLRLEGFPDASDLVKEFQTS